MKKSIEAKTLLFPTPVLMVGTYGAVASMITEKAVHKMTRIA